MNAIVWHHRIDIHDATLPEEDWDRLLDELKAEHVPSLTPPGKRMTVVLAPQDRMNVFIYRTQQISDEEVILVLFEARNRGVDRHGTGKKYLTPRSEPTLPRLVPGSAHLLECCWQNWQFGN